MITLIDEVVIVVVGKGTGAFGLVEMLTIGALVIMLVAIRRRRAKTMASTLAAAMLAVLLTMSATPIPRTLEMAVTGIREMSTIATPPEDRLPVLTFVGPYDDAQVAAAIRRELMRDGQVF